MELTLGQIVHQSWKVLAKASQLSDHPFRNFTIAHAAAGGINAYTVVLRDVHMQAREVIFYTDVRSEKIGELQADNHVTAVFYNRQQQVQLIVKGRVVINAQSDVALQHWKKSGYKGRNSYLAQQPPSTPVAQPVDGLEYLKGKSFTDKDMAGYENFAVVTINVTGLEYLKLDRLEGNRRARFSWVANEWQGSWIIP